MHDCGVDLTLGLGENAVVMLGVYDDVPASAMPGTYTSCSAMPTAPRRCPRT